MKPIKFAVCSTALMIIAFSVGCKKKAVKAEIPQAPEVKQNLFVGTWEGKEKNGDIYTVRFDGSRWEAHLERNGASRPCYRGTFTFSGSTITMRVTEEVNPKTFGWMPEKGTMPPNITARISGRTMKIAALTEAELVRKR
jgi:hypothetical protein